MAPGLLAADASTSAAKSESPAICGAGPLEILLTNDDGYQAPGIRALYDALREAGHHVRLAAPATNASGSSVSFTWSTVSVVRDPADPNVLGVAATPATAAVLGATALYPPGRGPDLVISGINDGENTGSLLAISGTVGAALAGTMLLDPPVPGIAVNAERMGTPDAPRARSPDEIARMARHLVAPRGRRARLVLRRRQARAADDRAERELPGSADGGGARRRRRTPGPLDRPSTAIRALGS